MSNIYLIFKKIEKDKESCNKIWESIISNIGSQFRKEMLCQKLNHKNMKALSQLMISVNKSIQMHIVWLTLYGKGTIISHIDIEKTLN